MRLLSLVGVTVRNSPRLSCLLREQYYGVCWRLSAVACVNRYDLKDGKLGVCVHIVAFRCNLLMIHILAEVGDSIASCINSCYSHVECSRLRTGRATILDIILQISFPANNFFSQNLFFAPAVLFSPEIQNQSSLQSLGWSIYCSERITAV